MAPRRGRLQRRPLGILRRLIARPGREAIRPQPTPDSAPLYPLRIEAAKGAWTALPLRHGKGVSNSSCEPAMQPSTVRAPSIPHCPTAPRMRAGSIPAVCFRRTQLIPATLGGRSSASRGWKSASCSPTIGSRYWLENTGLARSHITDHNWSRTSHPIGGICKTWASRSAQE